MRDVGESMGAAADAGFDGVTVRADFESGNVARAQVLSPHRIRFEARADGSPRPLWFYFCIEGAREGAVRCDLINADECFGPRYGWSLARPVYSTDGRNWERVTRTRYVEETAGAGYFSFIVPAGGPRTFVAYSHPYTLGDLNALLEALTSTPLVRIRELCRSRDNRSVPHLRIGEPDAARSIWVVARQHAGEAPASFIAEGLVRQLASATPPRGVEVHVVPMVDVDGVYHGRFGKNQPPVDLNRDWNARPRRPETTALIDAMRRPELVLDLHASHHGDTACYFFGEPEQAARRFVACFEARARAEAATAGGALRSFPAPPNSARDYLPRAVGSPVVTLEASYHLGASGRYLTPDDYRRYGEGLARAMEEYIVSTRNE